MARLEELGLVTRRASAADARVREAVITEQGGRGIARSMRLAEQLALGLFKDWSREDFDQAQQLLRAAGRWHEPGVPHFAGEPLIN